MGWQNEKSSVDGTRHSERAPALERERASVCVCRCGGRVIFGAGGGRTVASLPACFLFSFFADSSPPLLLITPPPPPLPPSRSAYSYERSHPPLLVVCATATVHHRVAHLLEKARPPPLPRPGSASVRPARTKHQFPPRVPHSSPTLRSPLSSLLSTSELQFAPFATLPP